MDEKEIAENSAWAAKMIQLEIFNAGRKLDNGGAKIIEEFFRRLLTDLFSGKDMTPARINATFKEIYPQYETSTPDEVINAANVIRDKFDKLIEAFIDEPASASKIIKNLEFRIKNEYKNNY